MEVAEADAWQGRNMIEREKIYGQKQEDYE